MADQLDFGKNGQFSRKISEGPDRFVWGGTYNTSGKTLRITLEEYEYNSNYRRLNPREIITAAYELSGFNNLAVEGIQYKRKLIE